MLVPASPKDLTYLRYLIRDGARLGGFDEALAVDCPESDRFFALVSNVITQQEWMRPQSDSSIARTPAQILMYAENAVSVPIGFVAVRGIGPVGHELWLSAIDPDKRRRGKGRRMLSEFVETEIGRCTCVAQCALNSDGGLACAHILGSIGFTTVRVGKLSVWMARSDAPSDFISWMKTTPFASHA
jgi:ribosomal protein S18 acetylase RimI-like enzyme